MNLQQWISEHAPSLEMIYAKAWASQVYFIRDDLATLVGRAQWKTCVSVIGTHRSKSVDLPVCRLDYHYYGLSFIIRNNFYNWKLSVISQVDIDEQFADFFSVDERNLSSVYFEGFPEEFIFKAYANDEKSPLNRQKWSAEIGSDYALWTTMWLTIRAFEKAKG